MMFNRSVHHKILNLCRNVETLSRRDPLLASQVDAIADETVIACSFMHHNTLRTIRIGKSEGSFHQVFAETPPDDSVSIYCSNPFRFHAILSNRESLIAGITDGTLSIQGPADIVMPLIRIGQLSLFSMRGLMRIKVAFLRLFSKRGGRE